MALLLPCGTGRKRGRLPLPRSACPTAAAPQTLAVFWNRKFTLSPLRINFRGGSFIQFKMSVSAPLPTVHGWEGLLCSRCRCLGSLSKILSKLLKVGRFSGSNAQHIVNESWNRQNKFTSVNKPEFPRIQNWEMLNLLLLSWGEKFAQILKHHGAY